MKCPQCQTDLMISDRQGIEIDFCSQCRGVWLDRGELDKLVQRDDDDWREYERERGRDRDEQPRTGRPPKKKRRWLSEMFEFGGDD